MALEVLVEPDRYLTTTQAVWAELGTTSTADAARLSHLIAVASRWAETYVGYPLAAGKYRETLAAYGTRNLMLSRTPVRAVAALYYGTDTGASGTEVLLSSEFGLDARPGFLTRPEGWEWSVHGLQDLEMRPVPGQEFEPWMADYVAGYTLDGISTGDSLWSTEKGTTSTGRTLPEDIEYAVIRRVVNTYTGQLLVLEKRVGDLQVKFAQQQTKNAVVDESEEILRVYRRVI